MKIKILTAGILLLFLSSCTKVDVVTDPYWVDLVTDFQESVFNLKVQSLLNGIILKIVVSDPNVIIPDSIEKIKSNKKNIIILSPLMSAEIDTFAQNTKSFVYYFTSGQEKSVNSEINTECIIKDRRKAFFDTGSLLGARLSEHSTLPIIYNHDDNLRNRETESFKEGIKSVGKDISFVYLNVNSESSEADIREFYDQINKNSIKYVVVFSVEFKYLSYNLAEKNSMQLITSDSWYSNSYKSLILYSIEDDLKGMLKKVYSNVKTGKRSGILLEGIIRK